MSNQLLEDLIEEHSKFLVEKKNYKKKNIQGLGKRLKLLDNNSVISNSQRVNESALIQKEIDNISKSYNQILYEIQIWQDQYEILRKSLIEDTVELSFNDDETNDA